MPTYGIFEGDWVGYKVDISHTNITYRQILNRWHLCYYIMNYSVEQQVVPVLLPPHPFTKIRIQHLSVGPMLSFISCFRQLPGIFNVLCVCSGYRAHKVYGMVYSKMVEPHSINTMAVHSGGAVAPPEILKVRFFLCRLLNCKRY